jgi:hypothetical protein
MNNCSLFKTSHKLKVGLLKIMKREEKQILFFYRKDKHNYLNSACLRGVPDTRQVGAQ